MESSIKKTISFCTTCRNRLWQIKKTLHHNLEILSNSHELVLIDYGSTDGLSDWVWGEFKVFIDNKKLTFFEVKNEVSWNVSRAKNLAHRIAKGEYLFNLDADNYLTKKDVALVNQAASWGLPCHQFSGDLKDGSCGRIGLPKQLFEKIGGYDETLLTMGMQDLDLLRRLGKLPVKLAKFSPPSKIAVANSIDDKGKESFVLGIESGRSFQEAYRISLKLNAKISEFKLATEGPIRLGGGFSYSGLLNGQKVIIDGFNNIKFT